MRRVVFFDLETGGLDPDKHPVTQIAAIAVDHAWRRVETFEAKISFKAGECTADALRLSRYDKDLWGNAAAPEVVAENFARFLRRHATVEKVRRGADSYFLAELAGHNAATFDAPFLHGWYRRLGLFCPATFSALCTLQRAKWFFLEHPELPAPRSFQLGDLCRYFRVHLEQAHDALYDVQATVGLYRELMARSGEKSKTFRRYHVARRRSKQKHSGRR